MAPLRGLAEPLADLIKTMPYPEIYPPEEEGYRPTGVLLTMFTDAVDREVAEAIVERQQASTAPKRVTQIRALGGAMARVPADATAFAHRDRRLMVNVAALFEDPDERPNARGLGRWARPPAAPG